MLPRANKIQEAVSRVLERNQRQIETDACLETIHLDVVMGRKSGMPVKIRYGTTRNIEEIDLTANKN